MSDHSEDQFDEIRLDDDFIRSAAHRELTAEDRTRVAARLRQERDEQHRREKQLRIASRPHRRAGRWLRRQRKALVVTTVLLMIGEGLWSMGREADGSTGLWARDTHIAAPVGTSERPTPKESRNTVPLGTPPAVSGTGRYLFLETQSGSAQPVTYDPCRLIDVVVNTAKAPAGGDRLISDAMAELSRATGLQFRLEGVSDEPASLHRSPYQPQRYGDRWAPILIAWTDPNDVPELKDDVAGMGGSSWIDDGVDTPKVYVSGLIMLDAPQMAELTQGDNGATIARSVVLHEFAHLVGLAHVDDPSELMNPEGSEDIVTFQKGDLAGLAQLGRGACVPKL